MQGPHCSAVPRVAARGRAPPPPGSRLPPPPPPPHTRTGVDGTDLLQRLAALQQEHQQEVGVGGDAGADAAAPVAPAPNDPKRQICFDFTKNQCSRGAACKFSHAIDQIIRVNSQVGGDVAEAQGRNPALRVDARAFLSRHMPTPHPGPHRKRASALTISRGCASAACCAASPTTCATCKPRRRR